MLVAPVSNSIGCSAERDSGLSLLRWRKLNPDLTHFEGVS